MAALSGIGSLIEPAKLELVNGPQAVQRRADISAMLMARMEAVEAVVRNVLLVYAALLPIVNPLGMAPIFAGITSGYDASMRRTVAMKVAVNGTVLLMASLFIGSYVLDFFGVSIGAVQLGGGLVVTLAGWHILNQPASVTTRPPPSWTAPMLTPKKSSTYDPMNSDAISRTVPFTATFIATVRRTLASYPEVMPAKIGAIPIGFTIGSRAA